jgi:hypothetical protein
MRNILLFSLIAFSQICFAQAEEAEIKIGDTLYFGKCEAESFQYIDLYVKTRFEKDSISYDSLNEWAFYNRFFGTGDFDVSRLPCSYSGKYGIVKHIMSIEDAEGEWHTIVLAMIVDGKSVAYIIESAFIEGEIIHEPVK